MNTQKHPQHHPDELTLVDYANDALDEAASLVVAAHVAMCPQCRESVRSFEKLGGLLLEALPASEKLSCESLVLDRREEAAAPVPQTAAGNEGARSRVDRLLALYPDQDWRWLGPGIRWKPLVAPGEDGVRAFLLKAQPGTRMPQHSHDGIEWTQVLTGAFAHEFGRYGPGDFDGADESTLHRPIVEEGMECICVVAMKGQLQLQGLAGRLLQPLVRF